MRTIAIARKNTLADNARWFAFVNMAMGDAGIFAWQEKFRYDLWRPVLGIREHDRSNGPTGEGDADFSEDCDVDWLPLGLTIAEDIVKTGNGKAPKKSNA